MRDHLAKDYRGEPLERWGLPIEFTDAVFPQVGFALFKYNTFCFNVVNTNTLTTPK